MRRPYSFGVADVLELIERDELLFDSSVVSHGFARHVRDYDVVIDVVAARPDGSRGYVEGRYRYRFTHCVEAHVVTEVSDDVWLLSWSDHFIDYAAWVDAGSPEGFVWGVNAADAYPGLTYMSESDLART